VHSDAFWRREVDALPDIIYGHAGQIISLSPLSINIIDLSVFNDRSPRKKISPLYCLVRHKASS
jgi:hypothetical protein